MKKLHNGAVTEFNFSTHHQQCHIHIFFYETDKNSFLTNKKINEIPRKSFWFVDFLNNIFEFLLEMLTHTTQPGRSNARKKRK